MTDLANLGLRIESQEVETGDRRLDSFAQAATRAERATDALAGGARRANTATGQMAAEVDRATAGLRNAASALESMDRRADALRASVDPLAMAMKRTNAEMHEAAALYKAGAIGAAEYGRYVDVLETRLTSAVAAQNMMNAAQAKGARSIGLTAAESLNLSRQMADVGVSMAMGMSPLMVMIQQGPQIADIFGSASARGVGFSGVLRGMVAAAGPLLPVLIAIGAAAAALAGVTALTANQLNKAGESADDLQKRLGLTDEQMKKVKNTSVTMGDVIAGSAKYAADSFMRAFGPALKWLGDAFQWTFDWIAKILIGYSKTFIGTFLGAFEAIRATWRLLPAAIGDAAISAVNLVVRAVEAMINRVIGAVNVAINLANAAAKAANVQIQLPTIAPVDLAEMNNSFAGAMEKAGTAGAEGFARGMQNGRNLVDATLADWQAAILAARDERVMGEAGDPAKPKAAGASNDNDPIGLNDIMRGFEDAGSAADKFADRAVQALIRAQEQAALAKQEMANYGRAAELAADAWDRIDQNAREAAGGMVSAFDRVSKSMAGVGRGIAGLITAYTGLAAREAKIEAERVAARRGAAGDIEKLREIDIAAARETARVRVQSYGDMAEAGAQFFKEGSDGYKVMQVAMIAFRTAETLMSIAAQAQKAGEVATHVAAEGTKAGASGAAAFARTLASLPFPANLAAGATILAALASVGVVLSSGGGGGSGVSASERQQKLQGAGSVLGDANAKSESIANSLEIVAANTNRDLEYSNAMLRALRSIDDQIGAVAAAIARSLNASGVLDTSSLKLGTSGSTPSLSNLGFSSSTTKTLKDMGLQFGSQSLADILAGGIDGSSYQTVNTKKKSTAFGITLSSSSSTKTTQAELDAALAAQFTAIVGSLRDGVVQAAGILGVQGAQATLDAFTVSIGKISLKDMSGSEIEEALQAVFSKLGDEMAGAVLPALTDLQNVGEGLFETLTRVARQYQVIDVTLSTIGKTFGAVGVSSLMARERLVDLFGSLDDFTEQVGFYSENFLTEAERLAPIQSAVTAELTRLGLASIKTRDQFKAVVQGLDVSTAAGSELFAALMSLAPAFAKVTEETQAVADAREQLSRAYERESDALTDTLDRFTSYAADLRKFGQSLYSGPAAALSPEAQYLANKAEFERVSGLAAAGNEQALGEIQGVSQAYLDASKAYYASSAGYFADLAKVRDAVTAAEAVAGAQADIAQQQLSALRDLVSPLISIDENILTVAEAMTALNAALGVPSPGVPAAPAVANDNSDMLAALQQTNALLTEQNAQQAQVIANQQAQINQQAAIYQAESADMREQTDLLGRQLREAQVS